jgi:3-dehydroquinate dehydratase-2
MKIVVLDGYCENPGDLSWAPLEQFGEVVVYDRTPDTKEAVVERLKDADILVGNKNNITAEIMDACPKLKFIAVQATGYNVIDVQAAKERGIEVDCRQSNHEGDLVDWIQEAYFRHFDGIVINPGAYTHTSIAIADAVHAIEPIPVVEVHISDILKREEFRHISYEAPYCLGQIKGHGFDGYIEAMDLILSHLDNIEGK